MDSLTSLPRAQKLYVALGGQLLFLVALLFLHWFGPFKATIADSWWIALVLAVVAGAFFLSEVVGFALPVSGLTSRRALAAAFLVAFWTVTHFLDGSDYALGAWIGLVASIVGVVGAWLVDTD